MDKNEKKLLEEFQDKIMYKFKRNVLLQNALTHKSCLNLSYRESSNERLEFLGDAVLELIASEYLYNKYPNRQEGELTRFRASIVCEQTVSECTKGIELGKYMYLGKGEVMTGGRTRLSILSDAMEAIIGAIYLDGGFASAKEFVYRFIFDNVDEQKLVYDSKTILQEIVQGSSNKELTLRYELIGEEGPDHDKQFMVKAMLGDTILGKGKGRSKKAAEQEAAYNSIQKLKQKSGR